MKSWTPLIAATLLVALVARGEEAPAPAKAADGTPAAKSADGATPADAKAVEAKVPAATVTDAKPADAKGDEVKADEAKAGAAAAQPAAPTPADIPALIRQLGDDSPKARQQASQALRKLGKVALPALQEAKKSDDMETATRADALIRQIGEDSKPKPPPTVARGLPNGNIRLFGGRGGGMVQVQVNAIGGNAGAFAIARTQNGDNRSTTVHEGGRTIAIEENKDGISVSVTETKDGKESTETFKAKDAETLKKEHPEAHKLYEQYAGKQQIRIQGGMLQGNLGIGEIQIGGVDPAVQQQIDAALEQARLQMQEHRKLAEDMLRQAQQQRDAVRRQLEEPRQPEPKDAEKKAD